MYISTSDLSVLLGLHFATMGAWPPELLPAKKVGASGTYSYAAVNEWLARPGQAFGFSTPLTIEQLVSGQEVLIRCMRAEEMIKAHIPTRDAEMYVRRRLHDGRLQSLKLRNDLWVVTMGSVQRHIDDYVQSKNDFSIAETCHILGTSHLTYTRLVNTGRIIVRRGVDNPNDRRVDHGSLTAFVDELLQRVGTKMSAVDWIDDRLGSSERLLTAPETSARLGLIPYEVELLLADGALHYIVSSEGNKRFISPDSVAHYQEQAPRLTFKEIGKILGYTFKSAQQAYYENRLACPLHPNEQCQFYRWCMAAFLSDKVVGMPAARWAYYALKGRKLQTEGAIVKRRLLTRGQLAEGVAAGRLPVLVINRHRVYMDFTVRKESVRYR